MMHRLFIALPIRNDDKQLLNNEYKYLCTFNRILKTVVPENYHITMKFIGECSEAVMLNITEKFNQIQIPQKSLPFTFSGIGVFPNIKKPNVVWVGLETDLEVVKLLHKNVDNFTSEFGIKKDNRKFSPHLTLARVHRGKNINDELQNYILDNSKIIIGDSSFDRLVLYSSQLTQSGPVYTELKSLLFASE